MAFVGEKIETKLWTVPFLPTDSNVFKAIYSFGKTGKIVVVEVKWENVVVDGSSCTDECLSIELFFISRRC